jgi:hypothetical protein
MPARDEIGTTAAGPAVAPVQVVFVRLPADAPRQPGEAPLEKKTSRRSPAKRRRGKQEKKRMIKLALTVAIAIAAYIALGMVPFLGHVAVTFPLLAAVPVLGAYICFLTFKGIASLALFSYVGRKLG